MYIYHWITCIYIILRYNREVKSHLDLKNYIYRPFYISKSFLINLIHYRFVFLYGPFVACIFNSPLLFALTTTLNNLSYWCVARNHDQFLHLHFAWILNINDFDMRLRCMVFAVAINYFSPGLSKIRHGGIKWIHPKTFKLYLQTFDGYISTTYIAKYEKLCTSMALSGLTIEIFISPLIMYNIHYIPYVVPILILFHIGIDLTMNMEFYLNTLGLIWLIQQYYLFNTGITSNNDLNNNDLNNNVLNNTSFYNSNFYIVIQFALTLLYSLNMRDYWPFNSIEIFAFNYDQCITIKNRQAHYYIEVKKNHLIHKHYFILEYFFEVYTSLDPEFYNLFPELVDSTLPFDSIKTYIKMRTWFKARQPFIDYTSGKDMRLCFDEKIDNIRNINTLKNIYGDDSRWTM